MKVYIKNGDCDVILDGSTVRSEQLLNENLNLNDDDGDDYHNRDEVFVVDGEKDDEELVYIFLIPQILLELREKLNVTTKATNFVSEKVLIIIRIE